MLNCLHLRVGRQTSRKTSRKELERTTDIGTVDMIERTDSELNEACLIEGRKFVASTAKFSPDWDIISLRPDMRPQK